MESKQRILVLDLIKIISMFLIVGAHVMSLIEAFLPAPMVTGNVQRWPYHFMANGLYFLNGFLFVSGVIAWKKISEGHSWQRVLLRRTSMILLSLGFFLLVANFILPLDIASAFKILSFTANLFSFESLNLQWLWYLSLDFQIHLFLLPFFSLALAFEQSKRLFLFLGAVLLCGLLRIFVAHHYELSDSYLLFTFPQQSYRYYETIHLLPWMRLTPFLFGAIFWELGKNFSFRHLRWSLFFLSGIVIFGVYHLTVFVSPVPSVGTTLFIGVSDLLISLALLTFGLAFKNPFGSHRLISKLSELTLGIYLTHVLVILFALKFRGGLPWVGEKKILLLWVGSYLFSIVSAFVFQKSVKIIILFLKKIAISSGIKKI